MRCLFHIFRSLTLVLLAGCVAQAETAILQIQVVEGEGTVHPAGTRSPHGLTVAVTDETGKPVVGAAVSFHLPDDGPGGTFLNGLRTDVSMTDARGRASVRALQTNRVPGQFQIRIVASKQQARAGTVSFQYVGEPKTTSHMAIPNRRWMVVAAAAGGGIIAALVASRGSSTPSTPISPGAVVPSAPPLSIGPPSISIGKP